jgi:exosortase C (VPDSG-CTERM-specific)
MLARPNAASLKVESKETAVLDGPPKWRSLAIFGGVLSLFFIKPLLQVTALAWHSDLHSHILLMPFISGFLIWTRRAELNVKWTPAMMKTVAAFTAGALVLAVYWTLASRGVAFERNDPLTFLVGAYYCFLLSGAFLFLGSEFTRKAAFALAILIFAVPLPGKVTTGLEIWLQYTSADASHLLFKLSNTPVFRQGLVFVLPGLPIEVARECSGIRSTLVLFITGLLASNLYLKSTWARVIFALATLPIGILRNAIRIFLLSMLTIHVDPRIMKSPLHSQGGPLFFVLSLVPFFGLLILLQRLEGRSVDKIPK